MELSENPATPAALRQRASLTGHYLPKVRHEATHSRQTKQKTMANSDGPRGSVHDFNGFLGPSTHQKHKFCPEASDGSQPMRRPRDVNILSHTLRQCQQRIDQFPPIQAGRWLQTDLRLAMEKDEKAKFRKRLVIYATRPKVPAIHSLSPQIRSQAQQPILR